LTAGGVGQTRGRSVGGDAGRKRVPAFVPHHPPVSGWSAVVWGWVLIGHVGVETTVIYPVDLQAAIARAHPRDQNASRPRRRRR
jgi:hypothetical protein